MEDNSALADPSLALPAPKLSKPGSGRSTKERLADADERSALFDAIIELGSVQRAAESLGLSRFTIYRMAEEDAEFEAQLDAARMLAADMRYDECMEIADDSSEDFRDVMNAQGKPVRVVDQEHIQRSKLRIDTRMRVAGKLMPKKYGDTPAAAVTVNNQVVQLVCDETTRARLIAQRDRVLAKMLSSGQPARIPSIDPLDGAALLPGNPA